MKQIKKVINVFLDYEDYKNNDKDHIYYIFVNEILKIVGEGEFLTYYKFIIDYKKKYCIFSDFIPNYKTKEVTYIDYKIILKPKNYKPLINIFIFNKIL